MVTPYALLMTKSWMQVMSIFLSNMTERLKSFTCKHEIIHLCRSMLLIALHDEQPAQTSVLSGCGNKEAEEHLACEQHSNSGDRQRVNGHTNRLMAKLSTRKEKVKKGGPV